MDENLDESLDESLDENLDEYLDESLDENLDETNVRDETINDTSILKLILEKLGIEKQITNNNNDNENTIKDDEKNNKKLFHGPYQPNYGTQINIDHLNLILDPSMLDKVSFSVQKWSFSRERSKSGPGIFILQS